MTENNIKTLRPVDDQAESETSSGNGGRENLKEMKTLIWMGIISVWMTLGLMLFTVSGNYRNSEAIKQLNDPERFSAVLETIDALRKEVAETQKALGSVSEDLKTQLAGVAGTVQSKLTANAQTTQEAITKVMAGQSRIGSQIQEGQASLDTSIARELKTQQTFLGKGQERLQAILNRMAEDQQTILEAVKSDNLQNTERRQILKQFFENQTTLVEKLSETFAGSAAGKTAP